MAWAKKLDADDPPDQRIAKVPDDDTDVAPHFLAKRRDAVIVQHHVGVDLHEERRFHLLDAGVHRLVKGSNVAHHDDVAERRRLPAQAVDRPLRRRFARGQHHRADVIGVTGRLAPLRENRPSELAALRGGAPFRRQLGHLGRVMPQP